MSVTETGGASGSVVVREYRVADARDRWDDWDELPREERHRRLDALDPVAEHTTHNVVVDGFLEHIVDLFDQSQSTSVEDISHFAVGTSTTAPATTDTSLGSEVFRGQIDTEDDQGKDLSIQGFLDSGQANGNTLEETALFTGTSGGSTLMVNRALISSTAKTKTKLVTLSYTLKFRDGG